LNEFLGNPCKIGEVFQGIRTVMQNLKDKQAPEEKLSDEQKVTLETLSSVFEGRYHKDELVNFILENPTLPLGEMVDRLCN